jgi:ABC-type ATPase involved in cell division
MGVESVCVGWITGDVGAGKSTFIQDALMILSGEARVRRHDVKICTGGYSCTLSVDAHR